MPSDYNQVPTDIGSCFTDHVGDRNRFEDHRRIRSAPVLEFARVVLRHLLEHHWEAFVVVAQFSGMSRRDCV